jgi:hypothetical protein
MSDKSHVLSRLPVQSGIVLGIVPLPVHFFLPPELSYQLAAITLVLIAGIYVGYAFKDGRIRSLLIELTTAIAFSAAGWLGINGHPSAIVIALALHGLWDILHHSLIDTEMPRWYIPFCAAVDWVMAASLLAIWTLMH